MAPSRQRLDTGTPSPRSTEIFNYLTSRTGSQIVQLMQAMRDPSAQDALGTALLSMPLNASSRRGVSEKPKKPLNSFVGFRSYYQNIPVFNAYQMKNRSPLLSFLWDFDPNKSKWSLLAKAWSIIRDQIGKERAPLDEFFKCACPYFNLPAPEDYLAIFGWVPVQGSERNILTFERNPEFSAEHTGTVESHEALSVEDIIHHVQSQGYAGSFVLSSNLTTTTFLGHFNATKSRTVPMKQTANTNGAKERRTAERQKRQTQREIARDAGIAEFFSEPSHASQSLGQAGVPVNWNSFPAQAIGDPTLNTENAYRGSDNYTSYLSTADQNGSADNNFYNSIQGYFPGMQPPVVAAETPSSREFSEVFPAVDYNTANSSVFNGMPFSFSSGEQVPFYGQNQPGNPGAFRMGANTDTLMPNYMTFTGDQTD